MGQDVIVHIGAAKCGSSAIQALLKENAPLLEERGILIPGIRLDTESPILGEQIWFFEQMSDAPDRAGILRRRFDRLRAAMTERGLKTMIVSAENIANHPHLAQVVRDSLPGALVRIVLYVRRQDDYFLSAWQQWYLKKFASLEAYLGSVVGRDANWNAIALAWADVFGDAAISVRPYRRDVLAGGDVVTDFIELTGLEPEGLDRGDPLRNRSFDESFGELAHRIRDVFRGEHDNDFYETMARLVGAPLYRSAPGSFLLTADDRRRIVDVYAEGNAALKARFLPELAPGPLFPEVSETDVRELSDLDRLRAENALLMRCVYALARRLGDR